MSDIQTVPTNESELPPRIEEQYRPVIESPFPETIAEQVYELKELREIWFDSPSIFTSTVARIRFRKLADHVIRSGFKSATLRRYMDEAKHSYLTSTGPSTRVHHAHNKRCIVKLGAEFDDILQDSEELDSIALEILTKSPQSIDVLRKLSNLQTMSLLASRTESAAMRLMRLGPVGGGAGKRLVAALSGFKLIDFDGKGRGCKSVKVSALGKSLIEHLDQADI